MKDSATVVVGGGPSGLLAAFLASREGGKVIVVEEEAQCGGLLKSFQNKDGVWFDYGSHLLRQTGIPEADRFLFGEVAARPDRWQPMPALRNGTYFNGRLYNKSGWVNLNFLDRPVYEKAVLELVHAEPPDPAETKDSAEFLTRTFGPTLVESLFRPALAKFCDTPLEQLSPDAHRFFDLSRLIAFTPEISRDIKKAPRFDRRLAFHFADEGQSGLMNYYPVTGGVGQWIPMIVDKLEKLGVRIVTGRRLDKVVHDGRTISEVELSDGERLPCRELVWSVAPYPLIKAAGLSFQGERLRYRSTTLHYFVFDRPLAMECAAFMCFDPRYTVGRVSYYPNFRSDPKDKAIYAACVEVMGNAPDASDAARARVLQDLKDMGLLERSARTLHEESRPAKGGFPVHTNAFVKQSASLRTYLDGILDNLVVVGKGTGKTFFMSETLIDTYHALQARSLR